MKTSFVAAAILVTLILIQCTTSKQLAVVDNKDEISNRPETNTVYKVFPDSEQFMVGKKEYNAQGKLAMEYQLVARPEKKGDSSYYFHALAYAFQFTYDDKDRLIEKTQYYHDTSTVMYKDFYRYSGDSMVHKQEAYDVREGGLLFTKLIAKEWYKDEQLVKRFEPKSYRDDHVVEYWAYGESGILKKHSIDNMTNDDMWYEGERIPYYAKKVIFLNDAGKPFSDSVYDKNEEGIVHTWSKNLYDEYATIYKRETTEAVDLWAEKPVPDLNSTFAQNIKPNPLRGEAKDPQELLNNILSEGKTERKDFTAFRDFIYLRKLTVNDGKIIRMHDSIKPEPRNGNLTSREQLFSYNEDGKLIKTISYIKNQGFDKKRVMETFDYHAAGSLKTKGYFEKYSGGKSQVIRYFEDGSRDFYAQTNYGTKDYPDSTITFYDPIRGKETGFLQYLDGRLVAGECDIYDDEGKLIREFNEKEYKDVHHFYDSNGQLLRSEFYRVNYDRFIIENPFTSELLHELHYGAVVK